jgi:hypothetical protein
MKQSLAAYQVEAPALKPQALYVAEDELGSVILWKVIGLAQRYSKHFA